MYKHHFESGVLAGLGFDAVAMLIGHPLPLVPAVALPLACGYAAAINDVDHHCAKIRFACPPARWLYLLIRFFVGLSAGRPCWYVSSGLIPWPSLGWTAESERRMRYWMGHRRITHTIDFAVWLGLAVLPLGLWAGSWWWLAGPAVTLGCLAHRAGDRLTTQGVPSWSWRMDRPARGWIVRTGRNSLSEGAFAVVQSAASLGLVWVLAGAPVPS